MWEEKGKVDRGASKIWSVGAVMLCCSLLSGCVVLEEKYNAEKTRSLNFQRLLAQEERRSAELESEVKRTKHELAEFEARNRELAGQVQTVREQMVRLQEEAEAIKESAILERKAMEDMRKSSGAAAALKKHEPSAEPLEEVGGMQAGLPKPPVVKDAGKGVEPAPSAKTGPAVHTGQTVHVVKPGETLFRISRRYGIEVEKLRKMNKLPDDIIEVGQKLIIAAE